MSFFGRALLTAAIVAGVVHVFRRDMTRIVGALRKPTETFLRDVKREIDAKRVADEATTAVRAGSEALPPSAGGSASGAAAAPPPPPANAVPPPPPPQAQAPPAAGAPPTASAAAPEKELK
jgi:hypothetical protein